MAWITTGRRPLCIARLALAALAALLCYSGAGVADALDPSGGGSPGALRGGKACSSIADCGPREWCHTGTCKCPIMFEGPGCKDPVKTFGPHQPGLSRWCLVPFGNWSTDGYLPPPMPDKSLRNFTSCAVVANSKTIMKKAKGDVIDAASAVFRMNEAPAGKAYARGVGKTKVNTLRFQNKDRGGFAEVKGELCIVWRDNTYSPKRSHKKCAVWRITQKLETVTRGYFKIHYDPKYKGRPMLSNGMLAVYFATHMCSSVSLHGFAQGADHYYKKFIGKPKGWGGIRITKTNRPFKQRHAWKQEGQCLKHLAATLPSVEMY